MLKSAEFPCEWKVAIFVAGGKDQLASQRRGIVVRWPDRSEGRY